jgi:hypothetical protein
MFSPLESDHGMLHTVHEVPTAAAKEAWRYWLNVIEVADMISNAEE